MTTNLKTRNPLPVDFAVESVAPAIAPELAPSIAEGIYTSQHQSLMLGDKIGGGGEGSVYHIQGQADLVAKIYHTPPSAEKVEKLIAVSKLGNERLFKMAAWPVDILRDRPDGNVIGFVMKKIAQASEVHTLHSPKSRLKKFPEASWAFLLHIATNIARAVATMHEHGFVIGDVNPKNILVTRQATVYLLDCDSFQFATDGKTYRCGGGFPEYTPPELQGIAFADVDRTPQHDCFGLAVVIFQLLFLGRHPFSGRFLGEGELPLEQSIHELRFAYGEDAATRQMQPPPGTLSLAAIPAELIALFRRAFLETDRPKAAEWLPHLEWFSQALQPCTLHSGHFYYAKLTACPWCDLETRAGIRLFNFKGGDRQRTEFRLEELWAEIEQLEHVKKLSFVKKVPVTQPSPEAHAYATVNTHQYWLALIFVFAVGGLMGWFLSFSSSFLFLILAGNLIQKILEVNPQGFWGRLLQALPDATQIPADFTIAKLKQDKEQAEAEMEKLEQELWGRKNGEIAYFAQCNGLKTKQHQYESLEQQRASQIAKLTSQSRTQIERDFENERHQLETEIISQIASLTAQKQEIDARRRQLSPAWTEKRLALAQANRDLQEVETENRKTPVFVLLALSFFLSSFLQTEFAPKPRPSDSTLPSALQGTPESPPNVQSNPPSLSSFDSKYKEGLARLKKKDYQGAKDDFLEATPYIDNGYWNDRYAAFYYNMCFTRVKLGEGQKYEEYLQKRLTAEPFRHDYRVQLIALHCISNKYSLAVEEYQVLKRVTPTVALSVHQEILTHGINLDALEKPNF